MTLRFAAEYGQPGMMNHVVDKDQETRNGKGIIASCHSACWAEDIAHALNHMVLDRGVEYDTQDRSRTT